MDHPDEGTVRRGKPAWLRRLAPLLAVAAAVGIACALAVPDGATSPRPGDGSDAAGDDDGAEDPSKYDGFVHRFRRAQQLFGAGKDAQAEEILRELLAERPDAAPVHHALAYIAWFRGKPADAIEEFVRAAALAPEDGAIRRDAGLRLTDVGRYPDAIPHLLAAKKLLEPDVETLCALGRSLGETGRAAEAERNLREAHALEPDSVDARTLLARQVLAARPEESLALLDGVPQNWTDVVQVRSLALERLGRWKEASAMHVRSAEIALAGEAGIPALRDAAEGLVRCGDAADATTVATAWVARDRAGDHPGLRASVCLAVSRCGAGDAAGALAAFDASPLPDAATPAMRAPLSLIRVHLLVAAGRPDEARTLLVAVAAMDVPFEKAVASFVLGRSDRAALDAAAHGAEARANDVAWAEGLRAALAGDAPRASEAFRRAAELSKPPGEHPGMLVRGAAAPSAPR